MVAIKLQLSYLALLIVILCPLTEQHHKNKGDQSDKYIVVRPPSANLAEQPDDVKKFHAMGEAYASFLNSNEDSSGSSQSESDSEESSNDQQSKIVNLSIPGGASQNQAKASGTAVTSKKSHRKKKRPILPKGMTHPTSESIVYEPQKLTFMFSAKNLDKAISSKQRSKIPVNPYVQLYYSSAQSDLHLLETEVLKNNPNPYWSKAFTYIWQNNTGAKWTIKIKSKETPTDVVLGELVLDVDKYVASNENMVISIQKQVERKHQENTTASPQNILSGPMIEIKKTISLKIKLSAVKLAHRDSFNGKSDPYVKCNWRRGPDGTDIQFGKTAVINNVENADWDDVITFENYQTDSEQYWIFKVYDDDGFSHDEFLGQAFAKIDSFMSGKGDHEKKRTIELTNEKGGRNPADRITGSLTVVLVQA